MIRTYIIYICDTQLIKYEWVKYNLLNGLLSIDDDTHGEYVNSLRYILYKMTE